MKKLLFTLLWLGVCVVGWDCILMGQNFTPDLNSISLQQYLNSNNSRQAKELYNRYFNVKFVSFTGDYNTCAQACPIQGEVISNMRNELRDKQVRVTFITT